MPAEPAIGGPTGSRQPPFGDSDEEQYESAARLLELGAACAAPGRLVLVSGPAGSGKTELCEVLLDDLDPSRCAVGVSARRDEPYAQLLAAILEAYGFKVEPGTSPQVMSDLIEHHAADSTAPGRQCVVVVDDADALPLRDLRAVMDLVKESALTLVLAGPDAFAPTVRRMADQVPLEWEHVELGGAAAGDVSATSAGREGRDELRAGTTAGGSRSARRAGGQGRDGARGSGGLVALLQPLLARLASAAGAPSGGAPGPFGFPVRHLVVLGGLILLLLLVYIVGQVAEEVTQTAASTQRVETLAMPPLETPDEAPDAAAGSGASPGAPGEQPAPATAGAEESAPGAGARPMISRRAPAETASAPAAPAGQAPATARAPSPAPGATPAQTSAGAAAASSGSGSATAAAGDGSPRNAGWIMGQPAGSYTVQLVSLSSAERARAYIAQQPDPGSFATYRLMRNGQLFHVVVYGAFADKAQADQAAARLPTSVGNIQPWVRTFGQVQDSIRTTPQ